MTNGKHKYINTGLRFNLNGRALIIIAREDCFKCHGKATFKVRRGKGKVVQKPCKCIRAMDDLPISWAVFNAH